MAKGKKGGTSANDAGNNEGGTATMESDTRGTDTSFDTTSVEAKAPKKTPTEVEAITMNDGAVVSFVGKRQLNKDYDTSVEGQVTATFDFRNGERRRLVITKDSPLLFTFAGHGAIQKVGDETAGEKDVDDMVVSVDAMIQRLEANEWSKATKSGDSFAGASLVIRAIMELKGLDQATVKGFLDKKLEQTPGLTRAQLYASFRNPNSKTAAIIQRMEQEKLLKNTKVDTDEFLDGL